MNDSKPEIVTRPIDPKTITPRQVADTAAILLGRKPSEKGTDRLAQALGAEAPKHTPGPSDDLASARLIAAAPDLLELLEETIMYVEECEQFHKPSCRTLSKRIRAAIRKAEGGAS